MKKQPGYILVLTLLIISLAVGLITTIVRQSFVYRRVAYASFNKARARALALSSLEIALAQLSLVLAKEEAQKGKAPQTAQTPQAAQPPPNEPQQGKPQQGKKEDPMQLWAKKALPYLNTWQTFEFDGSQGGLEGTVRLYIAAEDGKVSLPALEKLLEQPAKQTQQQQPGQPPGNQGPQQQAKAPQQPAQQPAQQGAPQAAGQSTTVQPTAAQPAEKKDALSFIDQLFAQDKQVSLKGALKDFKNRFKRPLDDPSELIRIKSFEPYKDLLFMKPGTTGRSSMLMDLFTTATTDSRVNPFLLSHSLKKLFGFSETADTKALAKGVKSSFQWPTDWDTILAPVYGKNYASLDPALRELLSPSFKITALSVVSYCKVGSITQKIYAILELAEVGEDFAPNSLIFRISRVYWL